MCPPLPLARRVRVAFRIGELMVHPMGSDPEQRSTFDGGDGANCKNILEPLGSLKAAMREQAMIRQANSHNGGQPVQEDGDEESAPGEEEQRRNSPKVKQCQKSRDQPVELVLVGLIFPRAVEPQDAHSGLWFLRKHSGWGCEEKLSNNAHLSFPSKLHPESSVGAKITAKRKGDSQNAPDDLFPSALSAEMLRSRQTVFPSIGSSPGYEYPGELVHQLLIGSGVLRFVARCALFQNRHKMTPRCGYANMLASHDLLCPDGVSVDLLVCVIVRTKGSALEGDSGKKTTGTRVAEDFSAHPGVRVRGSVAALGARGDGGICAEFHLAAQDGLHTSVIHHQQD